MKQSLVASLGLIILSCGPGTNNASNIDAESACASLGSRAFMQHAVKATDSPTDFAIVGAGYFVLERNGYFAYSRVGHFRLTDEGGLVSTDGRTLETKRDGNFEPFNIGSALLAPRATRTIAMRANLDASSAIGLFNPAEPGAANSSTLQSTVTVFEAHGRSISIDVFWTHVAERAWEFHAMVDAAALEGGTDGTSAEIATGTLRFDTDGRLVSAEQTSSFTPRFTNPQLLAFDFGSGLDGITQFASTSVTTFTSQDGYTLGALQQFAIHDDGVVWGSFSNGTEREIASIPLALFEAPQALIELPGNLLLATEASGEPRIGSAAQNGRGRIQQSMLEVIADTACTR